MIKAKHNALIYPFFNWLNRYLLWRHFSSITINSSMADNGHSVLIIANHISWWDGFWVQHLNQKTLKRKFYFMMLEEQLKRHWYFKFTGGYSVRKKSRGVLESIAYTVDLLNHSNNLVLMFPQGKIHSAYNNSFHFESGVQHIIKKCSDNTQVMLVANVTDYFSDAKPHLFFYTKTYLASALQSLDVNNEYNLFYSNVLTQHTLKTS